MITPCVRLAQEAADCLKTAEAFEDPLRRHELFEQAIASALASIALSLTELSVTTWKGEI